MKLPSNLISRFAKLTASDKTEKQETTVYGTIKERNGSKYVLLDGAEILTPVTTTVEFKDGERVTVLLKNHTATVTGNITSPARNSSVGDLEDTVKEQTTIIDNNKIYQGTTSPKDPIPGVTLWIDYSVDPPMLKRYSEDGKWEAVGTDKVQTSYIAIKDGLIDLRSGGTININSGAKVAIKTGGSFTVDANNLNIDNDGVIRAKKAVLSSASVNGTILANGYPVWHAGNVIVSSTQPSSPSVGTIWISPGSSVTRVNYYSSPSGSLTVLNDPHYVTFSCDQTASANVENYDYALKIPIYSYDSGREYLVRPVLHMPSGSTLGFTSKTITTYGLTWVEVATGASTWIGSSSSVTVEIQVAVKVNDSWVWNETYDNLCYPEGYQGQLVATALGSTSLGWQNATVKYYAG